MKAPGEILVQRINSFLLDKHKSWQIGVFFVSLRSVLTLSDKNRLDPTTPGPLWLDYRLFVPT